MATARKIAAGGDPSAVGVASTPIDSAAESTATSTEQASAPSVPKIYTALAKANKMIGSVTKSRVNTQQNFNFRGIDDVYNELHHVLANCEIFIIPEVMSSEVTERVTRSNSTLLFTRATIRHHFTTSDGSSVTTTTVGEAMDSADKGMNKAMSISLKYALLQLFTIPTREEKDTEAHNYELAPNPQAAKAELSPNPQAAKAESDAEHLKNVEQATNQLANATSLENLKEIFTSLSDEMKNDRAVRSEANRLKSIFQEKEGKQ